MSNWRNELPPVSWADIGDKYREEQDRLNRLREAHKEEWENCLNFMARLNLSEEVVRGTVLAQLPPYELTLEGFRIIPVVPSRGSWGAGALAGPQNWWFNRRE